IWEWTSHLYAAMRDTYRSAKEYSAARFRIRFSNIFPNLMQNLRLQRLVESFIETGFPRFKWHTEADFEESIIARDEIILMRENFEFVTGRYPTCAMSSKEISDQRISWLKHLADLDCCGKTGDTSRGRSKC